LQPPEPNEQRKSYYSMIQVGMTPGDWAFCLAQPGGASEFVRGLVTADMADPLPDMPAQKRTRTALVSSGFLKPNVLLTQEQLNYLAAKPGGRAPHIRRLIDRYRATADQDDPGNG